MILSIQYLRGIASLLVVLSHIAWKNIQAGGSTMHWWHEAGTFGVDIFFIISGYIMVYITQNMHQKPHNIKLFLKKRFIRIVPLYWFYTLVALAIFLIIPERVNSAGGGTDIFKSFFLLPLDSNENYLVGVGWTLHYEFIFYLLFSFGLMLSRRAGNIAVASAILFSVFYSIFIPMEGINYIFYSFLNDIFIEFALGISLYFFLLKIKHIPWIISLLSITIGIASFFYLHMGGSFTGVHHIDTGSSAFLICFGVVSLEYFWKKRECKLLIQLGNASYSIYLLHPFILVAVVMVGSKLENVLHLNESVLIVIMFITSLIGGYISHIIIEKRLIKYSKKLFN
jgi:peptidoglycan/LPS O-acetylase OafA/YrhL